MEAAREGAYRPLVIVNNDAQQRAKKGIAITAEDERLRLVRALRVVDEAFVAVDDGPGVGDPLREVRRRHPEARIVFCNGGDRRGVDDIPADERRSAAESDVEMRFGVGGNDKADSSSRILETLRRRGAEPGG